MSADLTPCSKCGQPTVILWGWQGSLLCKKCLQEAKNLPTLRELVPARSTRP